MEQFLTFPNIVLLTIFITILLLIIGYSIYTWVNDDELEAFDKFDKEYREGPVSQPWRRTPVRSFGETETRIVPSSIYLRDADGSQSPAYKQALQDALQRSSLDTSEFAAHRAQLASGTCFTTLVDCQGKVDMGPDTSTSSPTSYSGD
jgi:hypothetical protein